MKNFISLLFLSLSGLAIAESAYVTDQFKITIRSGESSQHRILNMIPTGSKLEVLSKNRKTGYSKVRTANGKEGYALTRQLLSQPVAREQLASLQAEVAALKTAPGELQEKLAALTRQHNNLQQAHKELQGIKRDIEQELAALQRTATNAVRISNERNELRKQVAGLMRTTEEAKQEKRELENSSAQRWFMIGAGVIAGGILIGLILPHLRMRKRKDSWGTL